MSFYFFKKLLSLLGCKVSIYGWLLIVVIFLWIISLLAVRSHVSNTTKTKNKINKQIIKEIYIKDQYITNMMYKYIKEEVKNIENFTFSSNDVENINSYISNIVN